ncbi:MAG: bifunctional phosphoribosylaminoimidazolecarboxamide formyltransferase/IMP cyclohydrolase [Candidatus Acididesulfobacter guangdongensis]|uniref:Bifunctional purine biosynthesis protein PurH n=1 Tax=Acididesulfobacter guangdongensis TaxID=2597225 RepID=A0A519BHN8_ACIG2|nr:MAG: bifunctional phosphoribosylaminoimidazolecarboxamide formyltransferase/IMP cyclohydrolase [Candidatus Acididesulfobacter guangdongensis]
MTCKKQIGNNEDDRKIITGITGAADSTNTITARNGLNNNDGAGSIGEKYALISVFDKTGIDELSIYLSSAGYTIIATGNTYNYLKNIDGIKLKKIDEITNFPEILSGRVKTLHPAVFGGILSLREDKNHLKDLTENSINFIDFVIVNLYPFKEMKDKDITFDEKLEYIDIGGVSLLRAAAKNFKYVTVLSDPCQYKRIIPYIKKCSAGIPLDIKFELAVEVFKQTAEYDNEIFSFLNLKSDNINKNSDYPSDIESLLNADSLGVQLNKIDTLRYGENPHQKASFYNYNINILNSGIDLGNDNSNKNNSTDMSGNLPCADNSIMSVSGTNKNFEKLSGKAISYNNLLDIDSCLNIIRDFYFSGADKQYDKQYTDTETNTSTDITNNEHENNENKNNKNSAEEYFSVIIKHTNPCGAAISNISLKDAFLKAKKADEISSYGGIMGFNRIIDKETATEIKPMFVEVIIAPDFEADALDILKSKKNTIIIKVSEYFILSSSEIILKSAAGGILMQEKDIRTDNIIKFKTVSDIKPDEYQFNDLLFAWKIAKHVKSNAIVYAKDGVTLGIGAGQMSRIDSAKFAYEKMLFSYGKKIEKCVMASDGFFPFKDSIEYAKTVGVSAIIEPGGSIRDEEVIEEANKSGIALVFTGIRHFKH